MVIVVLRGLVVFVAGGDTVTDTVPDTFATPGLTVSDGYTTVGGWVHPASRRAEITIAIKIKNICFRTESPFNT